MPPLLGTEAGLNKFILHFYLFFKFSLEGPLMFRERGRQQEREEGRETSTCCLRALPAQALNRDPSVDGTALPQSRASQR